MAEPPVWQQLAAELCAAGDKQACVAVRLACAQMRACCAGMRRSRSGTCTLSTVRRIRGEFACNACSGEFACNACAAYNA